MNFNNNMKQVLHILLTLLLLFTFSCNDDNVNNDNNSILIGSWGEQFPADEFFELTFYNDDTGVMTVYYNEGKKKSPDPFTYSFDKNTMRLVIFPVSTWERSYRYKGYGYNMCRETKKKLLQAIKGVNVEEEDVSLYTTGGWD